MDVLMNFHRKDTDRVPVAREMSILQAASPHVISPEFPKKVNIKNISGGGLCAVSRCELKKGMIFEARVALKWRDLDTFRVYCESVWSRQVRHKKRFEIGMHFLGIKDTDAKQLNRYIEEHIH